MDITIHSAFRPHDDPDASLAPYRDVLGFEVRNDVGGGTMRWVTEQPYRVRDHAFRDPTGNLPRIQKMR
jgi:catechol 2,3-dioxygenase-like lactoylglutathione lyase family enzyme